MCYSRLVPKSLIHARLTEDDRTLLEALKRATGATDSELIRRGLRLIERDLRAAPTALDVAGPSVGRFRRGPRDLATHPKHLEDFGR